MCRFMRGIDQVAAVLRRTFKLQRQQWLSLDRETFRDWDTPLARDLTEAVGSLYLSSARSATARAEHMGRFASLAKARAIESARSINETTADMLADGRDPWTADRVAAIAFNEALYARSAGVVEVAAARGQRLRWITERSNNPCEFCLKMNGRTVRAGKMFGIHDGVAVYQPPDPHFRCRCRVEVVGEPVARPRREKPGIVTVSWEEMTGGIL